MIELIRTLGIKPKVEKPDDIVKIMKVFGDVKEDPMGAMSSSATKTGSHYYPKFSIFFGEEGKGEAKWETFKYEVESVMAEGNFTRDQIMFGMRRALKGSAGDKVRRLGPGIDPEFIMEKLESDFGIVETLEIAMKKFYTCAQKPNESVESYASRLEELFYKGVELKGFRHTDTELLKQVLHSGLKKELKHMSIYQCDKIKQYEEFKKELRKLEADMNTESSGDKKPCKPAVATEKKEDSEVMQLLKQLNDRIGQLEKGQQQANTTEYSRPQHSWRGAPRGPWRGDTRGRSGGRFHNRGRGTYRPQRPYGSGTFAPTCYICNKKGHLQIDCPTILSQFTCLNCKEKGHIRRDCPNL